MVNYFNLLEDSDEENEATTPTPTPAVVEKVIVAEKEPKEKQQEKQQQQPTSNLYVPPLRSSLESTKAPSSQHIEIQFDFTQQNLDDTLPENWILWYDAKKNTSAGGDDNEYLQNVQKIGSFNTLRDFKSMWENLKTPLEVIGNISIFKEGIEPAWEDAKNKDGGKISVNYLKDNGDFSKVLSAWFTLLTTIVYSAFENYEQSNGIVLSIRSWGASIHLWNSSSEVDKVQPMKESFQNILCTKYSKFSPHKTSLSMKNNNKNDKLKNNNNNINNNLKKRDENGFTIKPSNNNVIINTQLSVHPNYSGAYEKQWTLSEKQQQQQLQPQQSFIGTKQPKKSSPYTVNTEERKESIDLDNNNNNSDNNNNTDESNNNNEPAIVVPEIPTGVNAWSTGIILGQPPKTSNPVEEKVEEQTTTAVVEEPIKVEEKVIETTPLVVDVAPVVVETKKSPYSNSWNIPKVESTPTPQPTTVTKPVVVDTPIINTNVEIPTGTNAWSTGKMLVKPTPTPTPQENIEDKQQTPNIVDAAASAAVVATTTNNKKEKKEQKEPKEKKVVEKKEPKEKKQVEKKEEKKPDVKPQQDKPMKRVNSREVLHQSVTESFWEDPTPVAQQPQQPTQVPTKVPKKTTPVTAPVVVEPTPVITPTESFSKVVKKDKSHKQQAAASKQTPSSSWGSPTSIADLIASQPVVVAPVIIEQPIAVVSTPAVVTSLEIKSATVASSVIIEESTTTITAAATSSSSSAKLSIKENKKVETITTVEKVESDEWISVEKKVKTVKKLVDKKEETVNTSANNNNNNLMKGPTIRNLLVEEPVEYPPTPVKPTPPQQQQQPKKQTANNNNIVKEKESKDKNTVKKEKEQPKKEQTKSITKPTTTPNNNTTTTTKPTTTTKSTTTTTTTTTKQVVSPTTTQKDTSIISSSLVMNLSAVIAVLALGFILKYLFA